MPKTLLLLVFGPLILVAVVLTSPFTCLYFLFDRACDCIEEFKPQSSRRTRKKRGIGPKQLAGLLNRIPTSERNPSPN